MEKSNDLHEKIRRGVYKLINKCRSRSLVWNLFAEIEKEDGTKVDGFVCCRRCRNLFKFNGKTSSNLNRHKCFYSAPQEIDQKRVKLGDKQIASDAYYGFCVEDCQPISSVEGKGFNKIAQFFINIGAQYGQHVDIKDLLPDSIAVYRQININSQIKKEEIKTIILEVIQNKVASSTIDIYTDNIAKKTILCVTLHFYRNGQLTDMVLGTKSLSFGKTNSESILYKISNIFEDLGVKCLENILFITDKFSSINNALQNVIRLNCSYNLFSDVLYFAFESTSNLKAIIISCKQLIKYLEQTHSQYFQPRYQKNLRTMSWNYHLAILKSITENWNKINEILGNCGNLYRLSKIDVYVLQNLVELYESFETISNKLQDCSTPSSCFVLPSICRLRSICERKDDDIEPVFQLKTSILNYLDSKWTSNLSIYHKAAFFLYPPTNSLQVNDLSIIKEFCVNEILRRELETKDLLNEEAVIETHSNNSCISNSNKCNSKIIKNFSDIDSEMSFFFPELLDGLDFIMPVSAKEEIERYSTERVLIGPVFDVLKWWECHSVEYPKLSKFALYILSIPASSAAASKALIKAGNFINEERSTLYPAAVGNVLFLNSLIKKCD